MEKKTNKYHLTLSLTQYANGDSQPEKHLSMEVHNHDELFTIIEKLQEKNPFGNADDAAQLALGLKLFGEVKLKYRQHPLFEEINAAFPAFMKKLKSL